MGFGYHAREDRLVIFLASGRHERQLFITRRICLGLVSALSLILERSAGGGQNLSDDVREAVVFIEHQRSIFDLSSSGSQGAETARVKLDLAKVKLVTAVNVKSLPQEFTLVMKADAEQVAQLKFGRRDLHRFLETLKTQAEKAKWDSALAQGWLGLADDDVTFD